MNESNNLVSPHRLSPSLRRVIVRSFRDAWDYLGLVLAASVFTALLPTMLAVAFYFLDGKPLWILVIVTFIIALLKGPILAGVFNLMHKVAYGGDPELSNLLVGFRESLRASVLLIVLDVFLMLCLAADAVFFFGILGPMKPNLPGLVLGCLFVYLLVVWFCATGYQFPALSAQKPLGQRVGVLAAVYKSLLAALSAPLYTLGVWLIVLVLVLICFLSAFGVFLLLGGMTALIFTHALKEIYLCCGVISEPSDNENT